MKWSTTRPMNPEEPEWWWMRREGQAPVVVRLAPSGLVSGYGLISDIGSSYWEGAEWLPARPSDAEAAGELREALRSIAFGEHSCPDSERLVWVRETARAALAHGKEKPDA